MSQDEVTKKSPQAKEAKKYSQEAEKQLKSAEQAVQKLENRIQKNKDELLALEQKMQTKQDQLTVFNETQGNIRTISDSLATLQQLEQETNDTIQGLEQYKKAVEDTGAALTEQERKTEESRVAMEQSQAALEALNTELKDLEIRESTSEWTSFKNILEELTGLDLSGLTYDIDKIEEILADYRTERAREVPEILDDIAEKAAEATPELREMRAELDRVRGEGESREGAREEFDNLKDSFLQFFSIGNAIEIFKGAIRSAFDSVKELDKAMTETAVVTDFSIGDMWEQLPRYTQAANELGTTTLGAYETMTLFYQQGLDTNEVFEIGTETMKMARIAGLDYADATDKMTAALRGFNMELNEMSAQRVNDVYSELAAITAADTEEIANAMTKTASIAHSANMEFETTAAFLSQIIETTRESAETAGTAMKTVIARFQELKKDPSEIGEVDGEIVDANKIEGALRTVGIALRDSTGQFRDLDDVFLELASKWDDLDTNTQRYIATVAAGSRQQSRFIAMMSNYDRTMQLVTAANESAGASQKQFEKTTESLESKLNKLSNAWQQFTMGLANNQVIKALVSGLTDFVNVINYITELTGQEGLGGVITSINKLIVTMVGLKIGQSVFDAFFKTYATLKEANGGVHSLGNAFQALGGSLKGFPQAFKDIGNGAKDVIKTVASGAKKIWSLIKSFGLIKTGLIAAGITIAVIGLTKAFNKLKYNSDSARLERTQKVLEQAGEAADQATESFNNLNESLTNLGEGTKQLEELTKGTKAWREAVKQVNDQMLDLIEQYPKLAPFVELKDGVLTINYSKTDQSGRTYDKVYSDIERRTAEAQNIELVEKIREKKQSVPVEIDKLDTYAKVYTWDDQSYGGGGTVFNKELTEQLARALATDYTLYTKEAAIERMVELAFGESSVDILKSGDADKIGAYQSLLGQNKYLDYNELRNFGRQLINQDEQISDWSQMIAANILNTMELDTQHQELLTGYMDEERVEAILAQARSTVAEQEYINWDKIAVTQGWTKENGKYYYEEDGEKKQVTWDDENAREAEAGILAGELIEQSYNSFLGAVKEWEKEPLTYTVAGETKTLDSDYILRLFQATNGGALTQEAIKALSEAGAANVYAWGGGDSTLGDEADFIAQFERLLTDGALILADTAHSISQLQLGEELSPQFQSNMDKLSADASAVFVRKLEGLDNEGAKLVAEKFNAIAAELDPQTLEDFTTQLNAMDWTDLAAWNGLADKMEELGIVIPDTELKNLAVAAADAANAMRKQEFAALQTTVDASASLAADISERKEGEVAFTKEQVDLLRQAAPEAEFVNLGEDEYIYLGENLNDLVAALTNFNQLLIQTTPSFQTATKREQVDTYTTAYGKMEGSQLLQLTGSEDSVQAEAAQKVLEARIAQEGLQIEFEKTAQMAEKANSAFAKNTNGLRALTLDAKKLKDSTKALCEIVEENNDAFSEGNKKLKKGESVSAEYYIALKKISDKAKDVFGDIATEDFVQANYEDFEKLVQGGEAGAEAFERIQMAAREATIAALETDERTAGILTDIIDLVAQADMDFQVNGFADITDIVSKLIEVGYQAEDAKKILESLLGASVEFEVQYQTVTIPTALYNQRSKYGNTEVVSQEGGMTTYRIPSTISVKGGAAATENSYLNSGYKPTSSKSGGGSGSKDNKWENSYDKLYNLTREINEELRERERIERRYQSLLKGHHTSAEDIVAVSEEEIAHLKEEAELQEKLISGRKKQMNEFIGSNSSMTKYANIQTNERGEQILRINWDEINKVTDEEKGQAIEDYISQLEEWLDSINEANDSLNEIYDVIDEIRERGKEEYFELEDKIKEAVVKLYQDEIDKLSTINESINDTNSRLIDAMQQSIDKSRQERDNAEKEKEISEKQRQLAYLQQDTSGANDLAILRLQEEISRSQQDYTDALIDQKISELQEQNDKAAEQRQQQIDLAQAQLDRYIESGAIWQEVYDLMGEGLDENNGLIRGSRLEQILQSSEGFKGLSEIQQMEWLKELNANIASALSYLKVGRQLENLGFKEGTEITFTTADGKTVKGKMDSEGNVTVDGKTYSDVYQGFDGNYYSDENYENKTKPATTTTPTEPPQQTTTEEWKPTVGGFVKIAKNAKFVSGEKVQESVRAAGVISGKKGAFKILKDQGNGNFYVGRDWTSKGVTGLINKKYLTKYKTGGLADFTGPAWLDGTKSKPEMVLNARDTQNFIQLKDILSSLLSRTSGNSITENNGDCTYDIDINVEKIGSDYDLDQMAAKVRSMITGASQYRNNNAIGSKR